MWAQRPTLRHYPPRNGIPHNPAPHWMPLTLGPIFALSYCRASTVFVHMGARLTWTA
jgi:hypothetical protein